MSSFAVGEERNKTAGTARCTAAREEEQGGREENPMWGEEEKRGGDTPTGDGETGPGESSDKADDWEEYWTTRRGVCMVCLTMDGAVEGFSVVWSSGECKTESVHLRTKTFALASLVCVQSLFTQGRITLIKRIFTFAWSQPEAVSEKV